MALNFLKIKENKTRLVSLTGLNLDQFNYLLGTFSKRFALRFDRKTLSGKKRKRSRSVKKSNILPSMEDKLFFILTYVKTYPIQQVEAGLFDMTQPQCNVWIHLLIPILNDALEDLGLLPQRLGGEIVKEQKGSMRLIIDGTERRIQRPKDSVRQLSYYSGKKNSIR